MEAARILAVAGPVAVAAAWLVVRANRATVWTAMGVTSGVLGAMSLATGEVRASSVEPGAWWLLVSGLVIGVVLYVATAVFMAVAGRWPPLARHAAALYRRREGLGLGPALAVAVLLVAPGEELLWRGVVQGTLETLVSSLPAAVLAWAAYVAANAVSGSLPIVLGAAVGGAAWTALAFWSGGVAASIGCHASWTALMIAVPPVPGRSR